MAEDQELSQEVEVKSYNFRQFVLAYGPAKCYTVCRLFYHCASVTLQHCYFVIWM